MAPHSTSIVSFNPRDDELLTTPGLEDVQHGLCLCPPTVRAVRSAFSSLDKRRVGSLTLEGTRSVLENCSLLQYVRPSVFSRAAVQMGGNFDVRTGRTTKTFTFRDILRFIKVCKGIDAEDRLQIISFADMALSQTPRAKGSGYYDRNKVGRKYALENNVDIALVSQTPQSIATFDSVIRYEMTAKLVFAFGDSLRRARSWIPASVRCQMLMEANRRDWRSVEDPLNVIRSKGNSSNSSIGSLFRKLPTIVVHKIIEMARVTDPDRGEMAALMVEMVVSRSADESGVLAACLASYFNGNTTLYDLRNQFHSINGTSSGTPGIKTMLKRRFVGCERPGCEATYVLSRNVYGGCFCHAGKEIPADDKYPSTTWDCCGMDANSPCHVGAHVSRRELILLNSIASNIEDAVDVLSVFILPAAVAETGIRFFRNLEYADDICDYSIRRLNRREALMARQKKIGDYGVVASPQTPRSNAPRNADGHRVHFIHSRFSTQERECAIMIQSMYRGYRARKMVSKLYEDEIMASFHDAATKIQAAWRGGRDRELVIRRMELMLYLEELEAVLGLSALDMFATKIQALWRGYASRKAFYDAPFHYSASKIQAVWRGFSVRRALASEMEEMLIREIESSVVRLQASWRGYMIRKIKRERGNIGFINWYRFRNPQVSFRGAAMHDDDDDTDAMDASEIVKDYYNDVLGDSDTEMNLSDMSDEELSEVVSKIRNEDVKHSNNLYSKLKPVKDAYSSSNKKNKKSRAASTKVEKSGLVEQLVDKHEKLVSSAVRAKSSRSVARELEERKQHGVDFVPEDLSSDYDSDSNALSDPPPASVVKPATEVEAESSFIGNIGGTFRGFGFGFGSSETKSAKNAEEEEEKEDKSESKPSAFGGFTDSFSGSFRGLGFMSSSKPDAESTTGSSTAAASTASIKTEEEDKSESEGFGGFAKGFSGSFRGLGFMSSSKPEAESSVQDDSLKSKPLQTVAESETFESGDNAASTSSRKKSVNFVDDTKPNTESSSGFFSGFSVPSFGGDSKEAAADGNSEPTESSSSSGFFGGFSMVSLPSFSEKSSDPSGASEETTDTNNDKKETSFFSGLPKLPFSGDDDKKDNTNAENKGDQGLFGGLSLPSFGGSSETKADSLVSPSVVATDDASDYSERYKMYLTHFREKDLSEIKKLGFVYVTVDKKNKRPAVFLIGRRINPDKVDMDLVLTYLIGIMDQPTQSPYTCVYVHAGVSTDNFPSIGFIRDVKNNVLPRKYKKNIGNLYIVDPSLFMKITLKLMSPFISDKFWKKLAYIELGRPGIKDLCDRMDVMMWELPQNFMEGDVVEKMRAPEDYADDEDDDDANAESVKADTGFLASFRTFPGVSMAFSEKQEGKDEPHEEEEDSGFFSSIKNISSKFPNLSDAVRSKDPSVDASKESDKDEKDEGKTSLGDGAMRTYHARKGAAGSVINNMRSSSHYQGDDAETVAAIRIQKVYRGYKARLAFCELLEAELAFLGSE